MRSFLRLPAALSRCAFALALLAACSSHSSGSSPSASTPCDPLAPPPTSLSNPLGIGQDDQGTLYVADLPAEIDEPRVFVGPAAGPLVRQEVFGSGSTGSGEYTLSFGPPGAALASQRALLLDVANGTATQMALGPAGSKSFLGGPGETPLTVVGASTVAGLGIVNLPGEVDYVADVSDGTSIVVTSPINLQSSADYHLFYGTADAMAERTIMSFNQALSGYPTIAFQVGSATYTMAIGGTFELDGGGPGPGTLDTGNATLDFTLRTPTPSTLPGFSFTCL
jgi:hypothetical protein